MPTSFCSLMLSHHCRHENVTIWLFRYQWPNCKSNGHDHYQDKLPFDLHAVLTYIQVLLHLPCILCIAMYYLRKKQPMIPSTFLLTWSFEISYFCKFFYVFCIHAIIFVVIFKNLLIDLLYNILSAAGIIWNESLLFIHVTYPNSHLSIAFAHLLIILANISRLQFIFFYLFIFHVINTTK